ncbi:MAG: dethiobiotin synthase [Neisseria sp.]|nr:dethiobiotin synthase [Neisseria sp.]
MFDFSEKIYFISGIDTDIGKTAATGALARLAHRQEKRVITQKPVQTGGCGMAADIVEHRRIQSIAPTDQDKDGITCSYHLPYAASPHLAARLAGIRIDTAVMDAATHCLAAQHDVVLMEGAGGLGVPLHERLVTADFVRERDYAVILVTCGRLGSINHTLAAFSLLRAHGLRLAAVVYNHYFDEDKLMSADTRAYLLRHAAQHFPQACWLDLSDDYQLKPA